MGLPGGEDAQGDWPRPYASGSPANSASNRSQVSWLIFRTKPLRDLGVASPSGFSSRGFSRDLDGPNRRDGRHSTGRGRGRMALPRPLAASSAQQVWGSWWRLWGLSI